MNREIKFRAWDKKSKQWLMVNWCTDIDNHGIMYPCLTEPESDIELMQYTGFKDAHGEDLYEGDVFEDDQEWYVIEWHDGGWWADGYRNGDGLSLSEFQGSATCFKQGNIYENPELLN